MYWKRIIAVITAEVAILALFAYDIGLYEPSVSIGLLLLMPLVFGVTLIAGLLTLRIDRKLGIVLLASSPVAPFVLMMFSFIATDLHLKQLYHTYCFSDEDNAYILTLDRKQDYRTGGLYAQIVSTTDYGAMGVFHGVYSMRENVAYLADYDAAADSARYRVDMTSRVLSGFPSEGKRISVSPC